MNTPSLRLIASRAGRSLGELKRLWMAARRRDDDAKRELNALVSENPSLSDIFRAFAHQAQQARFAAEKAAGKKRVTKREFVPWVKAGREGAKRITVVPGGLPTLGKRR